jgi:integral membrane protein
MPLRRKVRPSSTSHTLRCCHTTKQVIILAPMQTSRHNQIQGTSINDSFLRKLRRMGVIEGISTLLLFGVAMPLKYLANMPLAVRIAGSVHGGLFVCLAVMLLMAISKVPISRKMAVLGFVAAILPFGPFIYDRWLVRATEGQEP